MSNKKRYFDSQFLMIRALPHTICSTKDKNMYSHFRYCWKIQEKVNEKILNKTQVRNSNDVV